MPSKTSSLIFVVSMSFVFGLSSNSHAQNALPFKDSIIGTLSNPNLARDLELVGDQKQIVQDHLIAFRTMHARLEKELKESLQGASDSEKRIIRNENKKRSDIERLKIVAKIKDSLLPHQVERLEQLTAQRLLNAAGKKRNSAGLLSKTMIEYLEIHPQQEDRIREKSDEIRIRVAKQIEKILSDARKDLLAELTREQKDKYQKLVGDPLPFDDFELKVKEMKKKKPGNRGSGDNHDTQ